jgi:hypothetical protein
VELCWDANWQGKTEVFGEKYAAVPVCPPSPKEMQKLPSVIDFIQSFTQYPSLKVKLCPYVDNYSGSGSTTHHCFYIRHIKKQKIQWPESASLSIVGEVSANFLRIEGATWSA